jgi:hypothetical protein
LLLDYCLIGNDGVTRCWRNGGLGETAAYWQDFGVVFPPKGKGDIRGTRFIDINGDGRADWIVSTYTIRSQKWSLILIKLQWVGDKGDTDIYTNMRGPDPDSGSKFGLVPHWLHAERAHGGMGVPGVRNQIKFARILHNGKGKRDYVYIKKVDDEEQRGFHKYIFEVWANDSEGGTERKSDGNRYGDMVSSMPT